MTETNKYEQRLKNDDECMDRINNNVVKLVKKDSKKTTLIVVHHTHLPYGQ
jgi:hypothetical protein